MFEKKNTGATLILVFFFLHLFILCVYCLDGDIWICKPSGSNQVIMSSNVTCMNVIVLKAKLGSRSATLAKKKKRPLRLCIKSEHCFYHGISKNQAWLRVGVQWCAKSRLAAPPCQYPDHADIAW